MWTVSENPTICTTDVPAPSYKWKCAYRCSDGYRLVDREVTQSLTDVPEKNKWRERE